MNSNSLFPNFLLVIASLIAAVASRCVSVRDCPAGTKYLEDIRNNAIDNSSIQVLRQAYCGTVGSEVSVNCEKIPPCYQPTDKNFCIKAKDCCVALRLVKMKISYNSEVKALIKKSTCDSADSEVRVKCSSLLEVEELLLKNGGSDACITPNGLKGRCIPFASCHVYDGKAVNANYLQHLKGAVCSSADKKVCCAKGESFQYPCGSNEDGIDKISGGTITTRNEFPWMVKLIYKNPQIVCGGTLINSQFVVTAAHCVGNQDLVKVRFGGNINIPVDISILSSKYHENYRRRPMDNDVALIKIQKVLYQDSIRWVCLPPKSEILPDQFVVVGNGITEKGVLSQDQLKATLPNAGRDSCEKIFKHFIENYDLVICAGGEPGVDSCRGDSGGPLMSKNSNSTWFLNGIVSGGITDCTKGSPGFYTRVDRFLNWINSKMIEMI